MAIRVTADEEQADAAPLDESLVLEECAVVRWKGYTRSTFVACLADGTPVAESKSFKWRDGAPHDGVPAEALAALRAELEQLGWAFTGEGEEWYEVRYGRWVAAPEPEPEPEEELVEDEAVEDAPVARELPPPLPVHIVREPEPEPLSAPAPPTSAPVPVAPPPAREPVLAAAAPVTAAPAPRKRRPLVLVSLLGILAALGLGAYIAKHGQKAPTRTVQLVSLAPKAKHTTPARKPAVAKTAAAPTPARHAAPAAPKAMRLVVVNTGHASWLEVRRGSAAGPVLYSGILDPGSAIGYSGKTLWVRFAAAANFHISVDGRPVALQGTVDRTFSAQR